MKQSSKRFTSMIVALGLLVGSFLIFFELLQPTYGDLQTKKGTQLSSEVLLGNEQEVVSQAKKLIAQYETDSQAQGNLAVAMPSGPNVASALAQIYGIAQDNGVTVTTMNVAPPTVQAQNQAGNASNGTAQGAAGSSQIIKSMGTISIQVAAVGNYENLKNFLSQLETNVRIFDVTALSVQPQTNVVALGGKNALQTQDAFTYNITIVTYYQLQ